MNECWNLIVSLSLSGTHYIHALKLHDVCAAKHHGFWYRFSFINFSSLMPFFCIVIFQFYSLVFDKDTRETHIELVERSLFLLLFFFFLYWLCNQHFMNEFLRLVWAHTLFECMYRHMWNWSEYMIISHAPLLWWGCSFCLNENAQKQQPFTLCIAFQWMESLDAFRCNTIVFW